MTVLSRPHFMACIRRFIPNLPIPYLYNEFETPVAMKKGRGFLSGYLSIL